MAEPRLYITTSLPTRRDVWSFGATLHDRHCGRSQLLYLYSDQCVVTLQLDQIPQHLVSLVARWTPVVTTVELSRDAALPQFFCVEPQKTECGLLIADPKL